MSAGAGSSHGALAHREPLFFGGTPVAVGETAEIRLKVAESYTAEPISIPITVVRGAPGLTLFVTASVHGDELNGVAVIRSLLNDVDFSALKGTLIAVPVVNIPGFLHQTRELPDRRDLNRSFPGSPRGSLTARLADVLFREVIRQSDYGIDLHTGGGERTNFPQVRVDLADPRAVELAEAFGCSLIIGGAGPEQSLRRTACAAGVPTIVYEAGSARRFERPVIEAGMTGVINVLRYLGMMPGEPTPSPLLLRLDDTRWVRARVGGLLDLQVELGQPPRRGQTVSVTTNPFGRGRTQLDAPFGGLALGLTQLPLVHPGDPVCHIARLEPHQLEAWSIVWESGRIRR